MCEGSSWNKPMINSTFVELASYSILPAAAIGMMRYPQAHRSFHPFIFILIVSLLNEICSSVLIRMDKSNAVSTNILAIIEGILWFWQFRRWKTFSSRSRHIIALVAMITFWLFDNIIFGKIYSFSSHFVIFYSMVLVFLSIGHVNRQIVHETGNLLTNSAFIICIGTMLFNTYRLLVECFYVFDLQDSPKFLTNVFIILVFVNVFVNLLFVLATSWIPTRQRFSLPYSLPQACLPLSLFISLFP